MSRVETKESPKLKTINTWLDEIGDKSEMGIACKARDFVRTNDTSEGERAPKNIGTSASKHTGYARGARSCP
jgi:hypothetical protein